MIPPRACGQWQRPAAGGAYCAAPVLRVAGVIGRDRSGVRYSMSTLVGRRAVLYPRGEGFRYRDL